MLFPLTFPADKRFPPIDFSGEEAEKVLYVDVAVIRRIPKVAYGQYEVGS